MHPHSRKKGVVRERVGGGYSETTHQVQVVMPHLSDHVHAASRLRILFLDHHQRSDFIKRLILKTEAKPKPKRRRTKPNQSGAG